MNKYLKQISWITPWSFLKQISPGLKPNYCKKFALLYKRRRYGIIYKTHYTFGAATQICIYDHTANYVFVNRCNISFSHFERRVLWTRQDLQGFQMDLPYI